MAVVASGTGAPVWLGACVAANAKHTSSLAPAPECYTVRADTTDLQTDSLAIPCLSAFIRVAEFAKFVDDLNAIYEVSESCQMPTPRVRGWIPNTI
jgi:hypothetical protein